jgi:hypothetical protein
LLFGLIIFLMPRISRWFFRTYEDAVMQFIFVLKEFHFNLFTAECVFSSCTA